MQARQRHVGGVRQLAQQVVLHVEDAQRLLGALGELAELDEVPALVVRRRRVAQPLEQGAAGLDGLVQVVGRLARAADEVGVAELPVELVEFAPDLGVDRAADAAGVEPGARQARHDAAGVVRVERQPVADGRLRQLAAAARGTCCWRIDASAVQCISNGGAGPGQVEFEVEPHVEQPGDVFGPLDVPAHPEEGVRDSAQHGASFSPSAIG